MSITYPYPTCPICNRCQSHYDFCRLCLEDRCKNAEEENTRLRAAVRIAADTFRDYSDMLWDGTSEGNRRATELNRREIQMREALRNQPTGHPTTCAWTQNEMCCDFDTACGNRFTITNGTLSGNKMRFCCYCGHPVREVLDADSAAKRTGG